MPVFVQWKWRERRTKPDFLVVFHFIDDKSKLNLRTINPKRHNSLFKEAKAWMTWAPSHPEEAWLAEVLRLANQINGLKEYELRKLRYILEGKPESKDAVLSLYTKRLEHFLYFDQVTNGMEGLCIKLCPEYINYLKKILEHYLGT